MGFVYVEELIMACTPMWNQMLDEKLPSSGTEFFAFKLCFAFVLLQKQKV